MLAAGMAAVLLTPLRPALAWGPEAHRTIALIADRILQQSAPPARAKVQGLLALDKGERLTRNDIADEATWADVLREKSQEARSATAAWHSVPFKPDSPDLNTACAGRKPLPAGYPASHGPRDNCVVDKVTQFAAELRDPATSPGERLTALQFLLNLVGDLHDPLHAIDHGDQGGECVALQVGSKPPVRLATYWQDTLVREVVGADPARSAVRIMASVPAAEAKKSAEGNAEAWARDTYEVAKAVTYAFAAEPPAGKENVTPGKRQGESCATVPVYRVGADYETRALAAVKAQLAKAGIRLAAVLSAGFK